ncbi:hypothetical protein H8356DRAFT_1351088 [Neocallimastix lanati (nom. inval.)]|nr:hypothetical protein H8356DRAFT_1351088 [Neocallimastix sp. JGI-2020a]
MSDSIPQFDKFRGTENFVLWYTSITGYLKAKKLHNYIVADALNYAESNTPENNNKGKKDITARDALAGSIIFNNVADSIKFYIKDCESAFLKMKKLKDLYEAKNIYNTIPVINEIMELFRILNKSSMSPSKLEMLTIMFEALPKELQEKVNYSSSSTVDSFYKEIKDKQTTIAYRKSRGDTNYSRFNNSSRSNNSNNKQEKDDKMDIDNL